MKNSTLKQAIVLVVFCALAASFSSCNKGYGCPTNFKAVKAVVSLVK
ncbi:MAG: hypothetical protein H6577_23095 [Lewinellaceae bacterium]|nr:hypothetical protein [Saprospiraceae bacterium]MCB9341023.1 hypothetical protein [Lewinellaceae bacterium]